MNLEVRDFSTNAVAGAQEISSLFSEVEPSREVLSRVLRWQLNKKMQGTHSSKGISQVSGTTKKPFRQKGTGNARMGTKRAPQCRGGGIVFGPVVRDHSHKLNKKVRSLGLRMSVAQRIKEEKMFFVQFSRESKTRDFVQKLGKFSWKTSFLAVVGSEEKDCLMRCIRNTTSGDLLTSVGANVYSIMKRENLVFSQKGWEEFSARFL